MTERTDPRQRLHAVLASFDELAVAVSGGVDSMTLAHVAHAVLGPRTAMMHAVSPAVPPEATARVEAHADRQGWRLVLIDAREFDDPDYLANPVNRCFFCKRDLYGTIRAVWPGAIASGTNLDDLGDFRPGLKAADQHDVRHPFIEAGLDKQAVRAEARALGLADLAELPAAPCLSSRIETGLRVTPGRLALVLEVERLAASCLGSGTIRCRIRPAGLELQLEPALLARLSPALTAELAARIEALQARFGRVGELMVGPYARGSAFIERPPAAQ
jgi:uncharacterized protein